MNHTTDLDFFLDNAAVMKRAGISLPHLDHKLNLMNYVRIADDVESSLGDSARNENGGNNILDWGCGYGQMTWLLKRRGMNVTSFDIGPDETPLPQIPVCRDLSVIRSTHPTNLPFGDESFNAVLSCGVLEHVDECSGIQNAERDSLSEIHRVLQKNGQFFIYQLPQRAGWQEAVVRFFGLGYSHPRKYSGSEIEAILADAGFDIITLRRANIVPKNLTGLPLGFKTFYNRFAPALMILDWILCKVPFVNRIAGVLEVTAVKR